MLNTTFEYTIHARCVGAMFRDGNERKVPVAVPQMAMPLIADNVAPSCGPQYGCTLFDASNLPVHEGVHHA